ncbi:MAG: AI-2E family transporter [Chloroflexota bacterium]|jgi:predicted PurR-regulated permease PerM
MTKERESLSLPEISIRRLVVATLIVGLVSLSFWLAFQFHLAILILLAGIILSLAIKPAVTRLKKFGVPAWAGVLIIYIILAVIAVLFLRFGLPLVTEQVSTVAEQTTQAYSDLREYLVTNSNLLIRRWAESLPAELGLPESDPLAADLPEPLDSEMVLSQGLDLLSGVSSALLQIAAIFVIGFFWTMESERIKRSGILLLPRGKREQARELIQAIEDQIGEYVSAVLLMSAIIGSLAFVAYLIIGLPNALVLGMLMVVMELIPILGPIIGAIPAIVIALTISPTTAIWVVVALVVLNQLEANVIAPRVMKRVMDLRPLVTLLALVAFGSLFGILGALVALPLVSILQLLTDRYMLDITPEEGAITERTRLGVIRYELQELIEDTRRFIRDDEEESTDEGEEAEDMIEAIAVDLDSLLGQYGPKGEAE